MILKEKEKEKERLHGHSDTQLYLLHVTYLRQH